MKEILLLLLILALGCKCNTNPRPDDPTDPDIENPTDPDDPDIPTDPAALCNNNIKDGGEAGVDCGGNCAPCFAVDKDKELIIKHLSVANSAQAQSGDLSFGALMARLASNGNTAKDLVISLFRAWDIDQTVNGFPIDSRSAMSQLIVDEWKTRDAGSVVTDQNWNINLDNAPFRLLAITSRVDLQDIASGKAGEGRLIYGLDQNGSNTYTLIFEYNLAGSNEQEVVAWAKRWHQLSNLNVNSPAYLNTVVDIVNTFTAGPSDLSQLRTNEIATAFPWELREFRIAPSGLLTEVTRKQSPSTDLDGSTILEDYVNAHRTELETGNHVIKETFSGNNIMAGNAKYNSNFKWSAGSLPAGDLALENLDFISCVGCHGGFAPGTNFTHIKPRGPGVESALSPFMQVDLERRRDDVIIPLLQLPAQLAPPAPAPIIIAAEGPQASSPMPQNQVDQIREALEKLKHVKRVH